MLSHIKIFSCSLLGRHACQCQASKHKLVNNCIKCGRIVCEQEGAGPCFFCENLVCVSVFLSVLLTFYGLDYERDL